MSVPAGSRPGAGAGWAWWAEKNDLVIAHLSPGAVTRRWRSLDGKNPAAVENPTFKNS